jgi:hypothetical protein
VASEGGDRERSSWGEDRIEESCAVRWASPGRLLGRRGGKQEVASAAQELDTQVLPLSTKKTRRICKKARWFLGIF